jgi:hypothetical protein
MALYTVRKTVETNKRGIEVQRYELFADDRYVTGLDIPAQVNMDWYRVAAMRVRANILNRHDDPEPIFGAAPDEQSAYAFAEMLNA